jgi:hypothetical protein
MRKWVFGVPFDKPLTDRSLVSAVFTIKLLVEPPRALFYLIHSGGHTTNTVGVVLQDYKPR